MKKKVAKTPTPDKVLLSSDEDLLMAKYEFYLELLESYKEDKENEQSFATVYRIVASSDGPAERQTLDELRRHYNSELRDLEKGRKPREQVINNLNKLVELIETADCLCKQFAIDFYSVHGREMCHEHEMEPFNTLWDEFICAHSYKQLNRMLLAIYATFQTVGKLRSSAALNKGKIPTSKWMNEWMNNRRGKDHLSHSNIFIFETCQENGSIKWNEFVFDGYVHMGTS